MQLEATDLLLINRGGVNYKVTGAQLKDGSTVQPTDEVMVQRGSTLYSATIATLTSSFGVLQDTDFILVQRGDEMYGLQPDALPELAPSITLTLNCAGFAQADVAIAMEWSGARAPGSFSPQAQFPDSPLLDNAFYFSSSGKKSFTVSQLGSSAPVRVVIQGAFNYIKFEGSLPLTSVEQSAPGAFAAMVPTPAANFGEKMFSGCTRLTSIPLDIPFKNLFGTFKDCTVFNQDLGAVSTVGVQDFYSCFSGCTVFNKDVSSWDVSSATEMDFMFHRAQNFNQNLNSWGPLLSNVQSFSNMFNNARAYNQPMNLWDVSGAKKNSSPLPGLDQMFEDAQIFDQDLSGWCVTNFDQAPYKFATNSSLSTANYPVWGTCP